MLFFASLSIHSLYSQLSSYPTTTIYRLHLTCGQVRYHYCYYHTLCCCFNYVITACTLLLNGHGIDFFIPSFALLLSSFSIVLQNLLLCMPSSLRAVICVFVWKSNIKCCCCCFCLRFAFFLMPCNRVSARISCVRCLLLSLEMRERKFHFYRKWYEPGCTRLYVRRHLSCRHTYEPGEG